MGEIDKGYLQNLVEKRETLIERKVRTLVLSVGEYAKLLEIFSRAPALVLWKQNGGAHA